MFKRLIKRFKRTYDRKPRKVVVETVLSVDYQVVIPGVDHHYSLAFNTREDARMYKQVVRRSKAPVKVHIIRREYDGDFIESAKEVY